jgi:hypothetical protein
MTIIKIKSLLFAFLLSLIIDDEKWKIPHVNRQKELTILYAGLTWEKGSS